MKISGERLLSDLNLLKGFTDTPGGGVTRFSYGENDEKARRYIVETAEANGFSVRTDPVGNMYIRLTGGEQALEKIDEPAEKICIGSHIDTVRRGGWLDGIYGVIGGLEVLRTLAENGNQRAKETEVVIFAEEEGSNFGSTMTGSKFAAGIYGDSDLDRLKTDTGITLRQLLNKCGYPPYQQNEVSWDFSRIKAMLELHIEQGPVLEQEGKTIGVVESVFGMTTIEVSISGTGNHAGATPMRYRRDALAAAALCITEVERIANEDTEGVVVATVGKIAVLPNCSNVIPERAIFTIEVREKRSEVIDQTLSRIQEAILEISKQRGMLCEVRKVAESKPFRMDERIIRLIDRLAGEAGIPHRLMDSGAVHDTCIVAHHAPSGMIFVPSKSGRSHVPYEDTEPADLIKGAQLLLDTVLAL